MNIDLKYLKSIATNFFKLVLVAVIISTAIVFYVIKRENLDTKFFIQCLIFAVISLMIYVFITRPRNAVGRTIYIKSSCSKKLNDELLPFEKRTRHYDIEIGNTVVPGLRDNYVPVRLGFMHEDKRKNEEELQKTIKWIQGLIGSNNVTCERPTHPQSQIEKEECSVRNTDKEKTIYVKRPHSIWKKTNLIRESGLTDIKTMTDIELINDYSIYRLVGSEEAIKNAMKMIQDTIGKANINCESCKPTPNSRRNKEILLYNKLAMLVGVPNIDYKTIEYYLYPFILHKYPRYARKVTDILLEMERSKLYHLIRDPKALDDMVRDVELMSTHGKWYPNNNKRLTKELKLIKKHTQPQRKHSAKEHASLAFEETTKNSPLERIVYVKASVTKELTDRRGRKIYQIIDKSGVENLELGRKWSGGYVRLQAANGETYVPVRLTGSEKAVREALALVQEAVGTEHINDEIELPAAKNTEKPSLKHEYDEIIKGILTQCPSTRDTAEAQKKYKKIVEFQKRLIEEHFYPLINKNQTENLAREVADMLYDMDVPELLKLYEQYSKGNLSALEDTIISSLTKIEDNKRADRNRKKNARKRQRKKEEAAAKAKTKQVKEEEELAEEKTKIAQERQPASKDDASVCSDSKADKGTAGESTTSLTAMPVQPLEEAAPLPNETHIILSANMNAATQEDDISMPDEVIAGESAVLEEEETAPTIVQPLAGEDASVVSECISSKSQDDTKTVQEEDIGTNSTQGMAVRETITESPISSLNDESKISKTAASNLAVVGENDPLLIFLRSQASCIKGSVDEFYTWLVKSEDIDSMTSLKEAVSEEEYLNNKMKKGNGSSGVKGFKLKPFQRAVQEYFNDESDTNSSGHLNLSQCQSKTQEPPDELVCPISLVLMTNDPVLAADGITYERSSIEDWFKKSKAKGSVIYSPIHGAKLKNLALTPNIGIRNMARAFKDEK